MKKNTKRKKILSLCITIALVFCLMIIDNRQVTKASDEAYNVYTGDIDLTSYNENNSGITWDGETLTLDHVIINGEIIIPNNSDTTIRIKSSNILNGNIFEEMYNYRNFKIIGDDKENDSLVINSNRYCAINVSHHFTLGNCTLKLYCTDEIETKYFRGYASAGGTDFNVINSTLVSTGEIFANYVSGTTNISNSDILLTTDTRATFSCNDKLNITDSNIKLENSNNESTGLYVCNADDNTININDNSTLDISAGSAAFCIEGRPESAPKVNISSNLFDEKLALKNVSGYYTDRLYAYVAEDKLPTYDTGNDVVIDALKSVKFGGCIVSVNGGNCDKTRGRYLEDKTVTINLDESVIPTRI